MLYDEWNHKVIFAVLIVNPQSEAGLGSASIMQTEIHWHSSGKGIWMIDLANLPFTKNWEQMGLILL